MLNPYKQNCTILKGSKGSWVNSCNTFFTCKKEGKEKAADNRNKLQRSSPSTDKSCYGHWRKVSTAHTLRTVVNQIAQLKPRLNLTNEEGNMVCLSLLTLTCSSASTPQCRALLAEDEQWKISQKPIFPWSQAWITAGPKTGNDHNGQRVQGWRWLPHHPK